MLPFLALISAVVVLALWGDGIRSQTTFISACILSIGTFISSLSSKYSNTYSLPSCWLCIAVTIWVLFTTLPLSGAFEKIVGTQRINQNELVRNELSRAFSIGIVDEFATNFALSRNRAGTVRMVIFLTLIFSVMGLSSCLHPPWRGHYLNFLIFLITLIALVDFLQPYLVVSKGDFLGFSLRNLFPITDSFNPNLFAGFIALGCPSACVLCSYYLVRKKFILGLSHFLCFSIMTLVVAGSMSRGALLAYGISLIVVTCFSVSRHKRNHGFIIAILACITFVALGILLKNGFEQRLRSLKKTETDVSVQERITIWKDSIRIWRDYPLIGIGADAFRSIYPQYKSLKIPRSFFYPVNSYVQLLVEGGIVAVLLFIALVGFYIQKVWFNFKHKSVTNKIFIMAALGTISVAASHAVVDLAPYIPLYSIVLISIAGLALTPTPVVKPIKIEPGAVNRRTSIIVGGINPTQNRKTMQVYAIFSMVILMSVYFQYGQSPYQMDKSPFIVQASPRLLAKGLVYAPTSWQTWYHLGRYGILLNNYESSHFGERCISHAAFYNSNDYRLWERLEKIRKELNIHIGAKKAHDKMMQVMPPVIKQARENTKTKKTRNK